MVVVSMFLNELFLVVEDKQLFFFFFFLSYNSYVWDQPWYKAINYMYYMAVVHLLNAEGGPIRVTQYTSYLNRLIYKSLQQNSEDVLLSYFTGEQVFTYG